ncbi:MAG TPA: IPT/TIG domain-containing protein, partial [Thermoleophilaceae bacterium]|nr:IPT/TIG domain-containing protein [Thermoleophilaceae bacterium]
MRRISIICISLVAAALLAVPSVAGAAKGPKPSISRVTPMRVSVGNLLTIRGAHFKAQRGRNTVIFRNNAGRTAFAKPRSATSGKLVVRVPASVARLLTIANSKQRPTRLKLRVLSGQFSKFTPRRLSPVVTGLGDGDGTPGGPGGGNNVCPDDGDLLSTADEQDAGTDPCLADTDKDGMSDGWEYWSAKDLNIKAVPYPGQRPFPNALDPSDGGGPGATASRYDFDGDGLT